MTINRIKNKIRNVKIDKGLYSFNQQQFNDKIIMYHGIDSNESRKYNSRHFGVKQFEEQLILFKKKFDIVSVEEYFKSENKSEGKLRIAITFDDGFENNFNYALPLLEKHEIPATVYITGMNKSAQGILWTDLYDICRYHQSSNFIYNQIEFMKKEDNHYYSESKELFIYVFKKDQRHMDIKIEELFNGLALKILSELKKTETEEYWKLMSDEQIKICSKSNFVKIASHGFYHNNLGELPIEASVEEIKKSKDYLENLTQYSINSIAYPDGSYSDDLVARAKLEGFDFQLAVNYHSQSAQNGVLIKNRIGLYPLKMTETTNRIAYQMLKK